MLCNGLMARDRVDRFQQASLLSASETIFRYCLSIAECFIHNWSRFPAVLNSDNVETVYALLESREDETPCEELNEFSFDVLRCAFDDLCCVDRIVVDVLKSVGDDYEDDSLEA